MRFTTKLIPSLSGNLGIIHLNNPKALNAMGLDMIDCFQDILDQWYHDDSSIKGILVKSNDDPDAKRPIFCAGGDVKAMYTSRMEQDGVHGQGIEGLATADFFRKEYNINYALATCKTIPQISFWNGVVMGGGVGISVHGKYRVATEHSLFAMPETGLGLFPDVGCFYFLPRTLEGGLPAYVALTGHRLKPEDLMYTGLATHYVPSVQLGDLEKALADASYETATMDPFAPVLMKYHEKTAVDPSESFLAKQRSDIDTVFNINGNESITVEEIIAKLAELDNDFGKETLETLQKMSPTSMKITLEGLKRGMKANSVGEDLQMEFRMSQRCTRYKDTDFMEGVRALLVDKDKNPQWNPRTLEEVSDDLVEEFFGPVEQEWEIPIPTDPVVSKL